MKAEIVANYFLKKDKNNKIFNTNIICKNSRKSYEGNVRLNKYLFLTQVLYIARYGKKLIDDEFVAYDNGPVIKRIVTNFQIMLSNKEQVEISEDIKTFLDKVYNLLENAPTDELIEISHEDPEWIRLSEKTHNAPVMNLEKNYKVYKERYKGLIKVLDL